MENDEKARLNAGKGWRTLGVFGGLVLLLAGLPAPARAQIVTGESPRFPDVPPRASLIQVSTPNVAGEVTVTGAPGAVFPGGVVVLVTLDTGHASQILAGSDGSFSGSLFASAGTSILNQGGKLERGPPIRGRPVGGFGPPPGNYHPGH